MTQTNDHKKLARRLIGMHPETRSRRMAPTTIEAAAIGQDPAAELRVLRGRAVKRSAAVLCPASMGTAHVVASVVVAAVDG
ncbi:hypothetical protein [Bradyrhizobium sp. SRS-191]|uniref:hypothetical protein n=1 Tax=Bradyrhizobium sp. SRS-191 TaxID=2962606 RepID=UPI00211F30DF|nr:hypothetical protein [Bradyrhizobium sp. SRS-191]